MFEEKYLTTFRFFNFNNSWNRSSFFVIFISRGEYVKEKSSLSALFLLLKSQLFFVISILKQFHWPHFCHTTWGYLGTWLWWNNSSTILCNKVKCFGHTALSRSESQTLRKITVAKKEANLKTWDSMRLQRNLVKGFHVL